MALRIPVARVARAVNKTTAKLSHVCLVDASAWGVQPSSLLNDDESTRVAGACVFCFIRAAALASLSGLGTSKHHLRGFGGVRVNAW